MDSLKPVTRRTSESKKTDPEDDDPRRSGIRSLVTVSHGYARIAFDIVATSIIGLILALIIARFIPIDVTSKQFLAGFVSGLVVLILLKPLTRR